MGVGTYKGRVSMIPCRGAEKEMEQRPRTATRTKERFIIEMKAVGCIWQRVSHTIIETVQFLDLQ